MRRATKIIAIAALALVIGACAAKVQERILAPAVPADLVPATDLALPPFDVDSIDYDVISSLIGELPEGLSPCDIPKAIVDLEIRLLGVELKVGTTDIRYDEVRNGSVVRIKDPEKQIALGLLNPVTCETRTTIIVKHGDQLIAHESVQIEPHRRANGIRWNNWATEYTTIVPEGYAVVVNLYPYVQGSGAARKIIPVLYSPYHPVLHTPEMVERGVQYEVALKAAAAQRLRELRVQSKAFLGTLVADHPLLQEIAARLDPNEHMDPGEFLLDPRFTADRIHIIIGVNRERTARYTCSSAKACGITQYTLGTYTDIRRAYPDAKLMADTTEGRRDHLNASMAQLLLLDRDLSEFIEAFGPEIVEHPWIQEGLVAAYNTGSLRVINVFRIAMRDRIAEWTEASGSCNNRTKPTYRECLIDETKWYVHKERFLREKWNRSEEVAQP